MLQAIYGFDEAADMTAFAAPDGNMFMANGLSSRGDRPPVLYWYNASSTAAPDGNNVICPGSITPPAPGRYVKIPFDYNALLNLPALAAVALSGAYSDLSGKPSLATVATSGSYNDLSSKPSIPAAQVNSDWSAGSGLPQILNKPTLASVATSGAYSSLTGTPSLATVATSGSYTDLINKPTIPAGTVTSVGITGTDFSISGSPVTGSGSVAMALAASGVSAGNYSGVTVTAKGIVTAGTNRSFNSAPGRALSTTGSNNTYTISSTRDAHVSYTISFAAAITLTTSNGIVNLDYSTNAGSTWTTIASVSQAFLIAVTISASQNLVLAGMIPAGALVRINEATVTNVTITAGVQQEVLL